MKSYTISIHPELKDIEFTVKNGALFQRNLIEGNYKTFSIFVSSKDIDKVKKFAVKKANDKSSNKGRWYAHCNGYAMGLIVSKLSNNDYDVSINTYRPYGQTYI